MFRSAMPHAMINLMLKFTIRHVQSESLSLSLSTMDAQSVQIKSCNS